MTLKTYAPVIPLQLDKYGNFINISDTLTNFRQDIKMIMLTNPGEKIMDPLFGAGIRKYLFENMAYLSAQLAQSQVKSILSSQLAKYLPDITVLEVRTEIKDDKMYVYIQYDYKNIVQDDLTVQLG